MLRSTTTAPRRFDSKIATLPLDFKANDVSLQCVTCPQPSAHPNYRIDAARPDLVLARDLPRKQIRGRFTESCKLTLDLERNARPLRSLQLTAHSRGEPDRTL